MKKRVFIYLRVSTKEQTEGYSLGEQEERLRKYCEAMDWILVKVYIDGGFTGSNMDRPALQDMIKQVEKGAVDLVLVDKLDRLSRSQFDTLYMIQEIFTKNNVGLVSRAEAFDTSTPLGRTIVGILSVFAELERERIKERMKDGLEGRAKEGKYKGGSNYPLGYDYDQTTGKLVVNDYEALIVREIFDMFNNRTPVMAIGRTLTEKGYRTKQGKTKWRDIQIRKIVTNPVYIGKINHNGQVYDGLHDGIIPEEVFQKAREITEERSRENEKYKVGRKYKSPLGGLIWCGNCGAKYFWHYNGKNKDGSRRNYYGCPSRKKVDPALVKDPNCKNTTYRDIALEEIIFNEIRRLKTDPTYFDRIQTSVDNTEDQKVLKERIDQISAKLSKLMDLYTVDGIDMEELKDKIKPLTDERKSLTLTLEKMQTEESAATEEEIMGVVEMFEEALASKDNYTVNRVIAELIDHIVIQGEDIEIHWNF